MKTIALILGAIALLGCSSGNEYFPINYDAAVAIAHDSGSDIVSIPDHHTDAPSKPDATIKDASSDADAGCLPLIGSWPCDGPLVIPEAGPYDSGVWNIEAGWARSYVSTDIKIACSYSFPTVDIGYDASVPLGRVRDR
jgi:hypothetical protein